MVSTTPIRSMHHSRAERRLVRPADLVHNCPVSAPFPDNQQAQRPDRESRTWAERDAAVVWHGFTQMAAYTGNAPLVIERAEGREVIEAAGQSDVDCMFAL